MKAIEMRKISIASEQEKLARQKDIEAQEAEQKKRFDEARPFRAGLEYDQIVGGIQKEANRGKRTTKFFPFGHIENEQRLRDDGYLVVVTGEDVEKMVTVTW